MDIVDHSLKLMYYHKQYHPIINSHGEIVKEDDVVYAKYLITNIMINSITQRLAIREYYRTVLTN